MAVNKDFLYVMYMGGPDSIQAIEPFLYNLFTDRDIIDFGIGKFPQKIVAKIISKVRSKKVAPQYERLGGGSPQLPILKSLLGKVSDLYLKRYDTELETAIGMCYYHPFIKDTVKFLQNGNYNNIFVMTMYPQYSYTTSGACFSRFFNEIKINPPKGSFKVIPYWYSNESYNSAIANRISAATHKLNAEISDCHILFSAHSLPYYTLEKGDPYTIHLKEQVNLLVDRLKPKSFSISFQSKAGRMRWLEPSTKDEIDRLIRDNYRNVIVCPISFVSDHIETIIEIDEEYIDYARKHGLNIVRSDSLNDSEDFVMSIIDIMVN
ncbi:ferrochelatase [Calditerrivibrio nitroreducens]|uniref:Ferrochelatase n=1 Tax=Calditerrivibrio nitroreducens (strain DSM 19672 / NBRC 101217 / Yu37-1) TaxID=768670 RepID=E4TG76_CALNY|nr:ferrochelatase [Calditerrivibrio nitroreducens]ADR19663.1 ferrochelatase [Calditerrivibrio nitroreducens DSM 19672]